MHKATQDPCMERLRCFLQVLKECLSSVHSRQTLKLTAVRIIISSSQRLLQQDYVVQEIEQFVKDDVYVKAGLVVSHTIQPYHVVVQ